jgi:hypothetical protein
MEESFARGFGIDAHRATLHSSHPHLAVHQHGEQPSTEGGEFLVLLDEMFCSGVSMSVDANGERWIDDCRLTIVDF